MSQFVIRSMSTTDYVPAGYGRPEQKPIPYHIYLMKPEKRASAYWSRSLTDAQKFDTEEAAQAEIDRVKLTGAQIVPIDADARGIAPYWSR